MSDRAEHVKGSWATTKTPRIDQLRIRVDATIGLLELVRRHLTDLHVLAYNRQRAAEEAKVHGGSRDYALDNHGDPRARDLYAALSREVVTAIEVLATVCHEASVYVRSGEPASNRRLTKASATPDEIAAALAAQGRRNKRGEYQPATSMPQPEPSAPARDHAADMDALTSALRKMHPREQPDADRMTPREVEVWCHVQDIELSRKGKRPAWRKVAR